MSDLGNIDLGDLIFPGRIPFSEFVPSENRTVAGGEERVNENVNANLKRGWKEHGWVEPHEGKLIIVGGGPSLKQKIPKIKWMLSQGKSALLTVNGVHDFLLSKGIKSWFSVLLDAKEKIKDYITPKPGTVYFVASQCDPKTLERFEKPGIKKFLYHHEAPYVKAPLTRKNHVTPPVFSTVGLESILIGYRLGFRTFHMIGLDASYSGDDLYAYDKDNPYNDRHKYICRNMATGEEFTYLSSVHMACQVEDFKGFCAFWQKFVDQGFYEPLQIIFHGDGYLPKAASILHHQYPWVKHADALRS